MRDYESLMFPSRNKSIWKDWKKWPWPQMITLAAAVGFCFGGLWVYLQYGA